MKYAFWTLATVLVLVRVPSLVEPAGADQGLYTYVGQCILHGELPYRDAWDQKPPAIHYTYAALFAIWPHDSSIAAADLAAAAAIALLLVFIGRRATDAPGAGELAALVFLLFANPAFTRLGGIRTRAQCETFIALAVTGALALLAIRAERGTRARALGAGLLLGLGCLYKYNAVVYLGVAAVAWQAWKATRRRAQQAALILAGCLLPCLVMLIGFLRAGALDDLFQATVTYNLRYSGSTYTGVAGAAGYLLSFPIQHARTDALWFLGGLSCAALLVGGWRRPGSIVAVAWAVAACLAIAWNGSRGLPQYFVQAGPALALAAGLAGTLAWRTVGPVVRLAGIIVLAVAVGRITDFAKPIDYFRHDVGYAAGGLSRTEFLQRFGRYASDDKFSALAVAQLGDYLAARTDSTDRIYVFGFSPGAYVKAGRQSASRFFWSRPIVYEFLAGRPRYGPAGLLADLERTRPAFVVLERHDEAMEQIDSASYFLGRPDLATWLSAGYVPAGELEDYLLWQRRDLSRPQR